MSYLDPIASPEADIRRRLQAVPKDSLETRVSNLETAVGDHEFRLGGHDSRLDGHDNTLASYGVRIGTAEAAIVSLDGRMTTAEGTLTGHGTVLGDHETRIDDLEAIGGLGGLDARLTTAEGEIDALQAEDLAHDGRLDTAEATLVTHDGRLDALEAGLIPIVTNEAELLAAAASAKTVFVSGLIALTATFVPAQEGAVFKAYKRGSGFKLAHNGSSAVVVVRPSAKKLTFDGLTFTSDHPLTSGTGIWDIGMELPTAVGVDVSGLALRNCDFRHLGTGIDRADVSTAEVARGVTIFGCVFHSLRAYGIYVRRNGSDWDVAFNKFRLKDVGDTHTSGGNAIWFGNNGDYSQFHHNYIDGYGRHGIEYWNSQSDLTTIGGNVCGKIFGNTILNGLFTPHDSDTIGPASFGISAFGFGVVQIANNSVVTASIGIETYSDPVNTASALCTGNFVDDIRGQAFSVNNLNGGLFAGNIIGRVDPGTGDGSSCYGFQIINGGQNITIRGNRMKNSGNRCIQLNGARMTVTGITQAADAVFTVDAAVPTLKFYVGKVICLRDVAGMTEVNDRYLTITEVAGSTFKCGLNTTGYGAYSSGGIVQERYRNIVIEDNEFHIDEVINAAGYSASIWVYDFQHAVIRNNTRFYKAGLAGVSGFDCSNKGIVYQDDTGTPLTVNSGTSAIGGSNLSVQMFV